ncbi:MAG: hypothetical protein KGL74_02405, partial [Elusimicrobia bacterium]|nr:hypothetical protein [Elusimicrobiota bacterium]
MISFTFALAALALPLAAAQGALMLVDEFFLHRERALGEWESWGHAADSAVFAAVLVLPACFAPTARATAAYAAGAVFSTLMVTK